MPPKVLPKVLKGPGDILSHLHEDDRYFLEIFLVNLADDTREQIQQLFCRLDCNRNNLLTVKDFSHHNATADKELKKMWNGYKKRFDFDNNDTVTFDEFTKGLVLKAT